MLTLLAAAALQATAPHWDVEDRRAVSSVISPCLTYILSGEGIIQSLNGWSRDREQGRPQDDFTAARGRSDGAVYRASVDYEGAAFQRLRCSVVVPSGDLAGAIAQLDAVNPEGFTRQREGDEWRFHDADGTQLRFILGARVAPDGTVRVWAATPDA